MQPTTRTQSEHLSEEEKLLRAIGTSYLKIKREVEGIANITLQNLIEHMTELGQNLLRAQEDAQERRLKQRTLEQEKGKGTKPEKPTEVPVQ